MTASLLQRFGTKWNYTLTINHGFFDFMAPSFLAARRSSTQAPQNIAGGDGSLAAFKQIRDGRYQIATVADPLHLQGRQAIDKANRALSKQPRSGYVTPPHLVAKADISSDGGPQNVYD